MCPDYKGREITARVAAGVSKERGSQKVMNIDKIKNKLNELFTTNRVVFWNDAEGECEADLQEFKALGVE